MREALDTLALAATNGERGADALPWHALRYQHTAAMRARLLEHYAPNTVNKMLAALRGTLREAWRLGLMTAEDYHRAVDLPSVRGTTLPRGRALALGELRALFRACAADASAAGARDAALLALLYGAGLRRAEAVALDLADYNAETGELVIRSGKGRKARTVYATNGGQEALGAWLESRGHEAGALLCPVGKNGRVTVRGLTEQAVYLACQKRAEEAKVKAFSPHDMRRSFITTLLDSGADVVTVQRLAGHANLSTTGLYDRRGEAAKKKAAELLHVPYRRSA
jgi:site-specific recombinase XerD